MSPIERAERASEAPKQAATGVVEEHALVIGRVCMALLGTQHEAEEALLETLEALDGREPFDGVSSQRAWLAGVARRVCARRAEVRARSQKLGAGRAADSGSGAERPSAPRRARRKLDQLRPTEREALVLRFTAELGLVDVARACAVDESVAQARISRGLARLRALLSEEER